MTETIDSLTDDAIEAEIARLTRRLAALERAAAEVAPLRAVLDVVPAFINIKDRNSTYVFMNRYQATLYGVAPEAAIGRTAADLLGEDYGAYARRLDHEVLEGGKALPFYEETYADAHGVARTLLTTKAPVIGGDGTLTHVATVSLDVTEMRGAEAEARASRDREALAQQRLLDAIETLSEAFVLFDDEDRLVLCNAKYREFYDLSEALTAPGTSFTDIVRAWVAQGGIPEAADREDAWIVERLARHRAPGAPHEQRLADGRWLRVSERRTRTGDIVGVRTDVSELKAREAEMAEMQSWLDHAHKLAGLGFWVWDDIANRLAHVSDEFAAIFGIPAEDFPRTAEEWFAMMHPDDRAREVAVYETGERNEGTYATEYRIIRPDGEVRHVAELSDVIRDDDGRLIRTIGTLQDITEQRRVEAALRRSKQGLANAQRIASLGSWELDYAADELVWSDETYRIFGVERESFTPTRDRFYTLIHPDDRVLVREAGRRAHAGEPYALDHRIVRPDGQVRVVREHGEVVRDADGGVIAMRGSVQDITERWHDREALRLAKDAAEAANRAKSDFLANMSHELRTPLNAIIGFSELIRNQVAGPLGSTVYGEYAEHVVGAGRHLLGLINEVLDLAKVEAGKLELVESTFDAGEKAAECLAMVAADAAKGGVAVSSTLAEGAPALHADPRKLKQIVLNLLSNAVKFTPRGGRVCLSLEATPADGLVIAVADTGIGMEEAEIPRLLAPFAQAEGALSRHYAGTGLGLPLAKALAELHGGRLTVASTPGAGTTVTVSLPPERLRWAEGENRVTAAGLR